MAFQLGIEALLQDKTAIQYLKSKRVALLGHPASVTSHLESSADVLNSAVKLTALFGPQHGLRGDKQYNMMETPDEFDSVLNIPVFSLYGQVRRPTAKMMDTFDVILVDLQDVGCRIYTFITTLLYVMEESARLKKEVWVLDRPNPAGRPVEGFRLEAGQESFVGAGPLPMRHGLTIGEMATWFKKHFKLDLELRVVKMHDYGFAGPDHGWPLRELPWVNPSPNAASLNMARCYAGSVMLEGTNLSEGRGTTRPLEIVGAPHFDNVRLLSKMDEIFPEWREGCSIRPMSFEPTFYKFQGKLCHGFQIHADGACYDEAMFKPFRIFATLFRAVRELYPAHELWRNFAYEYVFDRLPVDVINGGDRLRAWVENLDAPFSMLDQALRVEEKSWGDERIPFLIY